MPKSTSYLVDVNVLLALASDRHHHHLQAAEFADDAEDAQLGICRVTQMGLLRLLTNRAIMADDVLKAKQAWALYQTLLSDSRFRFHEEPHGLDAEWRELSNSGRWTDDYLLTFARRKGLQVLTFDRGLQARGGAWVRRL